MPRKFEIEIIDSLSKKTDKELDKAILNPLQKKNYNSAY